MTEWVLFPEANAEFRLFTEPRLDFDNAVEFCQEQNSTLARVSNSGEFDFVLGLVLDIDFQNFFLGRLSSFAFGLLL